MGDDPQTALGRALGDLTGLVPYLRAETGPVSPVAPRAATEGTNLADGVWLSCQDLLEDPRWLADVVRSSGTAIGSDDAVVAASIFVQGYAYRLLALAVGCLVVGGIVPDSDPRWTSIWLSRGRPARVAYANPQPIEVCPGIPPEVALGDPAVVDHALEAVLDSVVERNLRPLIASVRSVVRIGARLLWGNVAASASTAFRTMEGCRGEWIVPLGERFFEIAPSDLRGLGSYLTITVDGRRGWFWERTNCCLYDRLPGGIRCADCSRTPVDERRAAYAASLGG